MRTSYPLQVAPLKNWEIALQASACSGLGVVGSCVLPLGVIPQTLWLYTNMVILASCAIAAALSSLGVIAHLLACGWVDSWRWSTWRTVCLFGWARLVGVRLVEGLLVDKLTLCTPFTTSGELHSSIKVIIVDDTGYRVNLGQLWDFGAIWYVVHNVWHSWQGTFFDKCVHDPEVCCWPLWKGDVVERGLFLMASL